MSLPFPPADWPDEVADEARTEYRGEISVVKPGSGGTYDPVSNTFSGGTPATTVMSRRPARIQHIRLPLESSTGDGWTVRRRIRFQVDLLPGDAALGQGLVVHVHDGGRDHTLAGYAYQLTSAINSSSAAVRTLETLTEGGRIEL